MEEEKEMEMMDWLMEIFSNRMFFTILSFCLLIVGIILICVVVYYGNNFGGDPCKLCEQSGYTCIRLLQIKNLSITP